MSVEKITTTATANVGSFTSSGNFIVPQGVTKLYVTVRGAAGGNHQAGYTGGPATIAGGYVSVASGGTYPVVIGAQGSTGLNAVCTAYFNVRYSGCSTYSPATNGGTGGTTTFDGSAIAVYGGTGATTGGGGSQGTATFDTSLPALYPSGAQVRVTGTSGPTNTGTTSVGGTVYIFIVPS